MYTVNRSEIAQWVNLLEERGSARLHALSQLGRIGVQARGRLPLRRGSLRTSARSFLTPAHLARLLEALSDPAPVVRRETAFVLGELGGEAALSTLSRLAADLNADVRLIAVDALAKIGGLQAVQALSQATYDDNERVRARAVHALGQLVQGEEGPEVETARETLACIWEGDASAYVRDAAREALVALESAGGGLRLRPEDFEPSGRDFVELSRDASGRGLSRAAQPEGSATSGEEVIEAPTPVSEPL